MRTRLLTALPVAVLLMAGACGNSAHQGGHADSSSKGDRTVEVEMQDFAFSPSSFQVKKGETVTFRFNNPTTLLHEAVIGDEAYQAEQKKAMAEHGAHDKEAKVVEVAAGKTGELTYTFAKDGTLLIGCHQPGHYEAGMKATVTVTA
jgi:uncharacterized cupredoxin-like copper-binding protein